MPTSDLRVSAPWSDYLVPASVCALVLLVSRSLPGVEESEEYGTEQQDVIESEEIDFA